MPKGESAKVCPKCGQDLRALRALNHELTQENRELRRRLACLTEPKPEAAKG